MRNSRSAKKRRKKDRTWAEAATLALQMSPNKTLGIRDILQTIFEKNLKEISLNKAAENVLTTMLNHHAQLPNCPFYRVNSRTGLYCLKESWLKKNGMEAPNLIAAPSEEDSLPSTDSLSPSYEERVPNMKGIMGRENHTYSIQGRAVSDDVMQKPDKDKAFSNTSLSRKPSNCLPVGAPCAVGSARRHSSPMTQYRSTRSSVVRRHPPTVTRANSFSTKPPASSNNYNSSHSPKHSSLDLETPNSILVHANMRALVNKETFSMLPASYRFKLTKLLPECDQTQSTIESDGQKIIVPFETALTNEFFTQAVQEWRERLTDGEFTRETQSRIVQEIAKERSKIDPWKEKFFEEYYGQKQVLSKRLRSRSQNLAAEAGHKMRDLGMEAQLALFAHLRPEPESNSENNSSDTELQISDDDDDDFFTSFSTRKQPTANNLHLRTLAMSNSYKKLTYAERIAKTKLANSRLSLLNRSSKSSVSTSKNSSAIDENNPTMAAETKRLQTPSTTSAIVMKPSWNLSVLRASHNKMRPNGILPVNGEESDKEDDSRTILNVQKLSEVGSSAIADHSYTSTPWQQNVVSLSSTNQTVKSSATIRSSTTLVLCPRANLVLSNVDTSPTKLPDSRKDCTTVKGVSSASTSEKTMASIATYNKSDAVKPTAHMVGSKTLPTTSDTERVLSLCARPLTPELFAPGSAKPQGVISNIIKHVPSSLPADMQTKTPSEDNNQNSKQSQSKLAPDVDIKRDVSKEPKAKIIHPAKLERSPTACTKTSLLKDNSLSKPVSSLSIPTSAADENTQVANSTVLTSSTVTISSTTPTTSLTSSSLLTVPYSVSSHPSNHSSVSTSSKNLFEPCSSLTSSSVQPASRPTVSSSVTSPLVPGRLCLAGSKRPLSSSPSFTSSPPTRWGSVTSVCPSPLKKTRTLAEIKAQMKAKRAAAAAANTRPACPPQPPGVVAANSHSHIFSATTFPVYFPMVNDANTKLPLNSTAAPLHPNTASYIRLPTTATPLEKVNWVSHHGAQTSTTTSSSNRLFQQPVASAPTTASFKQQVPVTLTTSTVDNATSAAFNLTKQEGKGKITLKIKAAGSAISLKVDADVIQKEMKRSVHSPSSNEDFSSDDTNSDESGYERTKLMKHRHGPIKLPKVSRRSSDSESDQDKSYQHLRSPNGFDTGQDIRTLTNQNPSDSKAIVMPPPLLTKPPPVFGVSPFNVSVKPASTTSSTMTPALATSSSLFQNRSSSLSFANIPVSSSWSTNKVVSGSSFGSNKEAEPSPSKTMNKYRSTSKGKSLQNMQELARTNMIHSDDSAGEDADSTDDEQGDSTLSTTTASENEKASESDDENEPSKAINNKRQTRSAFKLQDGKEKLPSFNGF